MIDEIANLPDISFIDFMTLDDVQSQLVAEYKSRYKDLTGKDSDLSRADPMSLVLYACSVVLYQAFLAVDKAGKMDLLKYSYGDYLDNIAVMKGLTREDAKSAVVYVRFTLSDVRPNAVEIPSGTRVTGPEGLYFETTAYAEVPAGETYADVLCSCQTPGVDGNGILPGELNILMDTIAYVASVENIEETSGGTDIEDDDSLAERIYLAPGSYSVAGPEDAYIYWTKTFNSSILDVLVGSDVPGEVYAIVIMDGGELPSQSFLDSLYEYLADENIRPLTDQVIVQAPEVVEYDLNVTYYINKSDAGSAETIRKEVEAAVDEYLLWQKSKIGRDINPSRLISLMENAGAKRIEVEVPEFTAITSKSIGICINQNITYGGIEDD